MAYCVEGNDHMQQLGSTNNCVASYRNTGLPLMLGVLFLILRAASPAYAANSNGHGVELCISAADTWSSGADTNANGAQLLISGAYDEGDALTNGLGAVLTINPLNVSSAGEGEGEGEGETGCCNNGKSLDKFSIEDIWNRLGDIFLSLIAMGILASWKRGHQL
jgi:hypothetical protein